MEQVKSTPCLHSLHHTGRIDVGAVVVLVWTPLGTPELPGGAQGLNGAKVPVFVEDDKGVGVLFQGRL